MVLYIDSGTGRVVDGALPPGVNTKILTLYQGGVVEAWVQAGGSGGSGGLTDSVSFRAGVTLSDTNAAPTDAYSGLVVGAFAEVNTTPTETLAGKVSGSGLADANSAPADSYTRSVTTFATSQTNSGITSPANAVGQNDGVVAQSAPSSATKTLTLTVPVASIPTGATYTGKLWFSWTKGALGSNDTITFSNPGGNTISTITLSANQNNLTTPVTFTYVRGTGDLVITFNFSGVITGGNQASIDAVGVTSANF